LEFVLSQPVSFYFAGTAQHETKLFTIKCAVTIDIETAESPPGLQSGCLLDVMGPVRARNCTLRPICFGFGDSVLDFSRGLKPGYLDAHS
jgi:hypothetical protein